MITNDRLTEDFLKYVSKQEAVLSSQVYLELCEVKRYYDIQYSYNTDLKKIAITAKKTKNGPKCAFVPIAVYETLNFLKLQSFIKMNSCDIVYLVVVHSDSTCVYYQLSDGLVEPTDSTAKHLKENKQEKLDNVLRKNRELLEQAALMGLPVTMKKDDYK